MGNNKVIKWVLTILLIVICISCFVIVCTLNLNTPSGTNAEESTVKEEPPVAEEPLPDVEEPIYSVFPRDTVTYDSVGVGHIGGTYSDTLIEVFSLGEYYFSIISTNSSDYDFTQSGFAVAKSTDTTLLDTVTFGEGEYICSTFSEGNIAVALKADAEITLYFFDTSLNFLSSYSLELDDAVFYSSSSMLFGTARGELFVYEVLPSKSTLLFKSEVNESVKLKQIFKTNNSFLLIMSGENLTEVYSYDTSLTLIKTLNDEYLDCSISTERFAIFCESGTLYAFDFDFELVSTQKLKECISAKFIPVSGGVMLVTTKGYYNLCPHFDVLKFMAFSLEYQSVDFAVKSDGGYILAQRDNLLDIIRFTSFGSYNTLYTFTAKNTFKRVFIKQNGFTVFLTNATIDNIFKDNFGESDVFWLCLK